MDFVEKMKNEHGTASEWSVIALPRAPLSLMQATFIGLMSGYKHTQYLLVKRRQLEFLNTVLADLLIEFSHDETAQAALIKFHNHCIKE